MYIILNSETRKYVAKFGNKNSYTKKIENAQIFETKELAENHKCGNEVIIRKINTFS